MAYLVRNSKEKIHNTQKLEICFNALKHENQSNSSENLAKKIRKKGISPYLHPTFKNPAKHFNIDWKYQDWLWQYLE